MGDEHGHIPDETFLVIRDGRTSSPRTLDQLIALADAGKLRPDDEIMQNIMGSPMPIGTAGEQPWFPGSAPQDLAMVVPSQAVDPVKKREGLAATVMSPSWRAVRIGSVAALSAGVLLAVVLRVDHNRRVDRAVREEAAAYARGLESAYQSIQHRFDRYTASPSEPHTLLRDIEQLMGELSAPRQSIPSETRALELFLIDMRSDVWYSPTRISADIKSAASLAHDAKVKFAEDDEGVGAHALAQAEQLMSTVPQALPSGVIPEIREAARTNIASAKAERDRMRTRVAERQRAAAEEARTLALLRWVSRDERAYCECLADAVKQGVLGMEDGGLTASVRSISTHNAAAGWRGCIALVRVSMPPDPDRVQEMERKVTLANVEYLLALRDREIDLQTYNRLLSEGRAAVHLASQPRVWHIQIKLRRNGLKWLPDGEYLVEGSEPLANKELFSSMIDRIFADDHDRYRSVMAKAAEIAAFNMDQSATTSPRTR